MKKIIHLFNFVLLLFTLIVSCKEDKEKSNSKNITIEEKSHGTTQSKPNKTFNVELPSKSFITN